MKPIWWGPDPEFIIPILIQTIRSMTFMIMIVMTQILMMHMMK